jgi:bifunctional pyridoxal-dependent enzyme with beta-cystathionase and maltose regulon repressor activities
MSFDFDAPVDRANTDSLKWAKYSGDVLPLWVADMDFAAPPAVIEACGGASTTASSATTSRPRARSMP